MPYFKFKMCIFGDGGVGKTTLIYRFITGTFSEDFKMTIGVDFHTKTMEIDGNKVTLQIWDFAGQHQFKHLLSNYIEGASGGIFMFDLTRFGTLINLKKWLDSIKRDAWRTGFDFPIILIGGKSDLEENRTVDGDYASEFGEKYNLFDYIECSSLNGQNVEKIFFTIARKMVERAKII